MKDIQLIIPKKKDLWFRKSIKEDPKTMDYNQGYDVSFKGYNYNDGTIRTTLSELKSLWYNKWINNFPNNIYFYVCVDSDFVGEVYAKYNQAKDAYEIGIIIKAEHRGKGYSSQAIRLLLDELKSRGVKKVFHEIPTSRKAAIKADLNNGFVVIKDNIDGMKKFGKVEKLVYLEKNL